MFRRKTRLLLDNHTLDHLTVMTAQRPKFQQVQHQFTQHMRDPENNPSFADIEARRMKVYSDLLFNNVKSFLENSFPVLSGIIDAERWQEIVRDYFKRHQARTPLFPKMPQEFVHYLADEFEPDTQDYPFMQELAHYEWLELEALLDAQDIATVSVDEGLDPFDGQPILNPLARPQAYAFPVHKISKTYLPDEAPAEPTYLIVYRDRSDEVGFMEINPITARLVELIASKTGYTGRQMLEQIATELAHPQPQTVIDGGKEILAQLLAKDVLLGAVAVSR